MDRDREREGKIERMVRIIHLFRNHCSLFATIDSALFFLNEDGRIIENHLRKLKYRGNTSLIKTQSRRLLGLCLNICKVMLVCLNIWPDEFKIYIYIYIYIYIIYHIKLYI
jgi:hypothetical protein